jgi:hypothetical protein
MSRLSRALGLVACVSLGPALYAYGTLLAPKAEIKREASGRPSPPPVRNAEPRASALSVRAGDADGVTGSIGAPMRLGTPRAEPPKVPGITLASLHGGALSARPVAPNAGWAHAFRPIPAGKAVEPVSASRQPPPPAMRPWRKTRAARAYRIRRPNFRFAIGIYPGW